MTEPKQLTSKSEFSEQSEQERYRKLAIILKAISDPKRLKIVDMLSCGELCACKILEAFQITQPTLSHDMRVLIQAGIVIDRRDGKNIYYALDSQTIQSFESQLHGILTASPNCICHRINCSK